MKYLIICAIVGAELIGMAYILDRFQDGIKQRMEELLDQGVTIEVLKKNTVDRMAELKNK